MEPIYPLAFPAPSFNLKDMAPGLGSETRLDRSKGDTRSDTVLLDSSATLITNEGRPGGGQGIDGSGARASQNQRLWNTPPRADNEETEGSDVPADYLLGDVEGEEEELYLLDPEHAHRESGLREQGWQVGPEAQTSPSPSLPRSGGAGVRAAPGSLPTTP